jgi:hypothetical protein
MPMNPPQVYASILSIFSFSPFGLQAAPGRPSPTGREERVS